MIAPNCSGVDRRPWLVMVSSKPEPVGAGGWPSEPAATWMFCSRIAATTSDGASERAAMRSGSSHTRMAYSPAP